MELLVQLGRELGNRFDHLELKAQFLTAEDKAQIKLPELAREPKPGPALIEIHD
jgi:hypothetical protein